MKLLQLQNLKKVEWPGFTKCPNKSINLTSTHLSELNPGVSLAQSTEQSGVDDNFCLANNVDNLDSFILNPLVTVVPPTQNPSQFSDSSMDWSALINNNIQVSILPQILTMYLL